jgi:hypothetical protein
MKQHVRKFEQGLTNQPLCLFPEGTTAGNDVVMTFQAGIFSLEAPIQMVSCKFPYTHWNNGWSWHPHQPDQGEQLWVVLRAMTQFCSHASMKIEKKWVPTEAEKKDVHAWASKMQARMAMNLGVPTVDIIGILGYNNVKEIVIATDKAREEARKAGKNEEEQEQAAEKAKEACIKAQKEKKEIFKKQQAEKDLEADLEDAKKPSGLLKNKRLRRELVNKVVRDERVAEKVAEKKDIADFDLNAAFMSKMSLNDELDNNLNGGSDVDMKDANDFPNTVLTNTVMQRPTNTVLQRQTQLTKQTNLLAQGAFERQKKVEGDLMNRLNLSNNLSNNLAGKLKQD